MANTGYKIIQYIDDNPNSVTYGEVWTERQYDTTHCPNGDGEWEIISSLCEMATSGYTGRKITTYYNETTDEYSSVTSSDTSCTVSSMDEDWVDYGFDYCEEVDGKYTGYKIQEQRQENHNLANYGQIRENKEQTPDCLALIEPVWETISRKCNLTTDDYSGYLVYDGTADIIQMDVNPSSSGYNTFRTVTVEDDDCLFESCEEILYEWRYVDDYCGSMMPPEYNLDNLTDDTVYHVYREYEKCIFHEHERGTRPTNTYSAVTYQTGVESCVVKWVETDLTVCEEDAIPDYFSFTALEDGTFSFTDDIQFSTNNGRTWTTLTANTQSPTIRQGNMIFWKSNFYPQFYQGSGHFSSTGRFTAQGNSMSLVYGDNYSGKTSLDGYSFAFMNLFYNCSGLTSAEYLVLPATTLASFCYTAMFNKCTSLTTPPQLPASVMQIYCYASMFEGCASLTSAPILSATTMAESCYGGMFVGCTSLENPPSLPANTLAVQCYHDMFSGCTSLTSSPQLPATTLEADCYASMFWNCTSLTSTPALPATTLAERCYFAMFYGCTGLTTASASTISATTMAASGCNAMFADCTSLTTAPQLLSTTLSEDCYHEMFRGCSSLTTAPDLPATTLVRGCYGGMFDGCTMLNYIKCYATGTINENTFTYRWLNGVASTGTFYKNSNSTWTTGTGGIPNNWTVRNI